jgi:hypothetical protein
MRVLSVGFAECGLTALTHAAAGSPLRRLIWPLRSSDVLHSVGRWKWLTAGLLGFSFCSDDGYGSISGGCGSGDIPLRVLMAYGGEATVTVAVSELFRRGVAGGTRLAAPWLPAPVSDSLPSPGRWGLTGASAFAWNARNKTFHVRCRPSGG